MRSFRDRRDAGRTLAQRLEAYAGRPDVIVLALPRGGVPVAYEIAAGIGAPLDVLVVRKLGVPGRRELAMGAIASGGIRVVDDRIVDALAITREQLEAIETREWTELARRERAFRVAGPMLDVAGKTVILVDDGLATGSSMMAAIEALRTRDPAKISVAVPVAPRDTYRALVERADAVTCLVMPERLYSIGAWYEDFAQTTDAEVVELLAAAARQRVREPAPEHRAVR